MKRALAAQRSVAPKVSTGEVTSKLAARDAILIRLRQIKPDLTVRYHLRSLGLFGSYGRGSQTRRSDIDILVSFTETPTLFAFVRLKRELEHSLGKRVDLVMREALRPSIGRRIVAEIAEA